MNLVWKFKLTSKEDYATPMPNLNTNEILILASTKEGLKVVEGFWTWGVLNHFSWNTMSRFTYEDVSCVYFTWRDLEQYTWYELEQYTWYELLSYRGIRNLGYGWYMSVIMLDLASVVVLMALHSHCSQCDEKFYLGGKG